MINVQNMINTTNINDLYNSASMLSDSSYLIKVEMVDGTSQLIEVTKEQAVSLGIEFESEAADTSQTEYVNVELLSQVNLAECELSTPNILIKSKKFPENTQYNYKVIQPADLNLHPNNVPPLAPIARGRPKKRPNDELQETKHAIPVKMKKPSRTRSGRITRPPGHMEKDFAKIVTNEDKPEATEELAISTTIFHPLKTNNTSKTVKQSEVVHEKKKKRNIPSQYRCTTCKKAYLGRNRMAQHLKKHPDHGNQSHVAMEDCDAWCSLIESALKAKDGQKGSKFCKEVINLIKNIRILVKYFFKPAQPNRSEYYIDGELSSILNVKEGNYRFNENELCKDISIFSFLEFIDDSFANHVLKVSTPKKDYQNILSLGDELDCTKKLDESKTLDHEVNLHFGSDILDVIKEKTTSNLNGEDIYPKDILFDDKSKHNFNNLLDTINESLSSNQFNDTNNKNNYFECNNFTNNDISNGISTTNKISNSTGKEIDIFRNTIGDILNKSTNENIYVDNQNQKVKSSHDNTKDLYSDNLIKNPGYIIDHIDKSAKSVKKTDDFDINKLHLLSDISDELIIPDTGQVSNILDTSTNSDDIMNVDQFVNERFKKLTESDDLPNNSLGLDLPVLDCFNFHTS